MKKKYRIIFVIVLAVLMLFVGCSKEAEPIGKLRDDNNSKDEIKGKNEKMEETSANILRWAIPDIYRMDQENLKIMNIWLMENGYDFAVEFVQFPYETYIDSLKQFTQDKSNPSIDVAFVGLREEQRDTTYERIVDGFYEPMDEYLQTNEGGQLRSLIAEQLWNTVKVNNTIYTIPNGVASDQGITYYFNKKYMTEHDVNQFAGDISKLSEYMKTIPVAEGFSHLLYGISGLSFGDLIDCDVVSNLILPQDGRGVYNFFEAEEVREYYQTIHMLYQQGYIGYKMSFLSSTEQLDLVNKYLDSGQYFVYIGADGDLIPQKVKEETIPYTVTPYLRSRTAGSTGVLASSTQKEKGFTLLNLAHTNSVIANLLIYGQEGKDYELKDGFAYQLNGEIPDTFLNKLFIGVNGNIHITANEGYNGDKITDRKDYYSNNIRPSRYLGYHFDQRGYEEVIKEMNQIVTEYLDCWKEKDVIAKLDEGAAKLNELELETLMDAFRVQFKIGE